MRVLRAIQKERSSKSYAKGYYKEEKAMGPLFRFESQALDEFIIRPGRLFDAMMGPGRQVVQYAKKGFQVVGNDYNPHMVSLARKACQKERVHAEFHNKDVSRLRGIPSNTFDYVICTGNSLGCVPGSSKRRKALQEFSRILKPGGIFALHIYNRFACAFIPDERKWLFSTYLNRDSDLEIGDWIYHHGKELGTTYNHIFSLLEAKDLITQSGLLVFAVRFIKRDAKGYCKGPLKSIRAESLLLIAKKAFEAH